MARRSGHDGTKKNARAPGGEWRISCFKGAGHNEGHFEASSEKSHPGFTFDEIVADDWLFVEKMGDDTYYVRLGTQEFDVTVSRNKKTPSTATPRTSNR